MVRLYQLFGVSVVVMAAWIVFTGWTPQSERESADGPRSGGSSHRSFFIFSGGK